MAPQTDYTKSTLDAAERWGVSVTTVQRWVKLYPESLPYKVTRAGWKRFREEDIEAFADSLLSEPQGAA